jgi:hypothetical protein
MLMATAGILQELMKTMYVVADMCCCTQNPDNEIAIEDSKLSNSIVIARFEVRSVTNCIETVSYK